MTTSVVKRRFSVVQTNDLTKIVSGLAEQVDMQFVVDKRKLAAFTASRDAESGKFENAKPYLAISLNRLSLKHS